MTPPTKSAGSSFGKSRVSLVRVDIGPHLTGWPFALPDFLGGQLVPRGARPGGRWHQGSEGPTSTPAPRRTMINFPVRKHPMEGY